MGKDEVWGGLGELLASVLSQEKWEGLVALEHQRLEASSAFTWKYIFGGGWSQVTLTMFISYEGPHLMQSSQV